ncbi:unnamed protein product [Linum trigynum]|uniref:CCAAT-binding factor domain-containing protein n=1 Tax=Linum trigynum TaxID=586398 RepID=A0AAV2DS67_9ROSI
MKNDVNLKRVSAFAKRLLQVAMQQPPQQYTCGCLFLLSESLKARPPLWNMVLQSEAVDEEEEHFEDVVEDNTKVDPADLPPMEESNEKADHERESDDSSSFEDDEEDKTVASSSDDDAGQLLREDHSEKLASTPESNNNAMRTAPAGGSSEYSLPMPILLYPPWLERPVAKCLPRQVHGEETQAEGMAWRLPNRTVQEARQGQLAVDRKKRRRPGKISGGKGASPFASMEEYEHLLKEDGRDCEDVTPIKENKSGQGKKPKSRKKQQKTTTD